MTAPEKTPELLACPWCGAAGSLTKSPSYGFYVGCSKEGAHSLCGTWFKTRDAAIAAWNRRTPTTGGEEDTARLDWLEANPDHVLDNLCEIWCCYPPDTEAPDNYQGGTVREAIDAARTTRSTGEE